MSFAGHELVVINNNWAFDITTFTGYRTYRLRNGEIKNYAKAVKVTKHNDGTCGYKRYIEDIPVGVMRKFEIIIDKYMKDNYIK